MTDELLEIARALRETREQKKEVEAQKKELSKRDSTLELKLFSRMSEMDVQSFDFDGRKYVRSQSVRASESDPDVFRAWAEENGHASLIKQTIHKGSLSSFVREQIENGQGEPPGIETFVQKGISIRRG